MSGTQPTDDSGRAAGGSTASASKTSGWWSRLWTGRRRPITITAAVAAVALIASASVVGYQLTSAQADANHGAVTATTQASQSTDTSSPTEAPTPTATPTATPTPAPTTAQPSPFPTDAAPAAIPFDVPTKPAQVLPVDCAGLVPESVRVEVLGDAGHLLNTGGPANDDMIAAEWQAGVLRCSWFNATESASMDLTVLPNGLDDFRKYSTTLGTYGSVQLGPDSRVACDAASRTSVWSCRGGFVPDGDWVEFNFGGARTGVPAAEVVLGHLADAITASLTAAGPSRPVEALPAGTPRGWTSCSQWDSAGLRSALGAPSLGAPYNSNYALTMTQTALNRLGWADCNWTANSGLGRISVSVLPGGGWAVPDAAAAIAEYPTGTTRIVAVPGAQAATLTCFLAYGNCLLRASVKGTLLMVSTVTLNGSGRDATSDAIATATWLVAHLPA